MEKQEQKLIDKICTLFKELIEEEEIRFDITTKRTIYPRNFAYVSKAKELYSKAVELENINSNYSTYELKSVLNKEIYFVEHHEYKYKDGRINEKSVTELQNYMHNATKHIQMYFYEVLGDINF